MTCVFYSARLYSLGVNLERPKVSIICCYTSASKLGYLDASLNRQDIPVEKVYIDNSTNRFHNAASALNFGAEESSGELLFFCHQDIKFKSSDSLSKLAAIAASKLRPGDVGGVAGATNGHAYMMITHGEEELPYTVGSMFKGESIEVETVDECVIILPRGTWGLGDSPRREFHLPALRRLAPVPPKSCPLRLLRPLLVRRTFFCYTMGNDPERQPGRAKLRSNPAY